MLRRASNKTYNKDGLNIVGDSNTINGDGCVITGNRNTINGDGCNIVGNGNIIHGDGCSITGDNNRCYGDGCSISGKGNKSEGDGCINNGNVKKETISAEGMFQTFFGVGQGIVMTFNNHPVDDQKRIKVESEPIYVECPTEQEKEHDKEGDGCVVCLANVAICICAPCNHMKTCVACSRILCGDGIKEFGKVECPVCKSHCISIKRVFL